MIDLLKKLISEYYQIEDNVCGGNLHLILDDGNTDDISILFCHDICVDKDDYMGMLICSLLIQIDELERDINLKHFEYEGSINHIQYYRGLYDPRRS